MIIAGKRSFLADSIYFTGFAAIARSLPLGDSLLVLAYHRIGNPGEDLFDPGVFSATADQLEDQVRFLKRHLQVVTLEEALAVIDGSGRGSTRRCRVLITFDDGSLDNFELAYPVLHSLDVQGVFFLTTDMVGSSHISWWDRIAFLLRTAQRRRFSLSYPYPLEVDIDRDGLTLSLRSVLHLYKQPANTDPDRFLGELSKETQSAEVPSGLRRFLDWDEAKKMVADGMAIGSHTVSHNVLSQLPMDRQRHELVESRRILQERLGTPVEALAYPVGAQTSFTIQTQQLAREAGYRVAFSNCGGRNFRGGMEAFNIKRSAVSGPSWRRFRVQVSVYKMTGNYWP